MPSRRSNLSAFVLTVSGLFFFFAGLRPIQAQFVEPGTVVIHTFTGEAPSDLFGWVSEDIGDITGDGVHDLVITAPGNDTGGTNRGRVYVYNGATGALVFPPIAGTVNGGRFGDAVNAAGDVDGDGVRDIIVGSPAATMSRGRAAIVSGANGTLVGSALLGEVAGDQFGYDVSSLGDINGDGRSEFLVGAPGNDAAGSNAGRVYVYSGADGFPLLHTIDGLSPADRFGSAVAPIGDVNGDGINDFVVGAESYGPGLSSGTGQAYVYSGADCLLPATPTPIWTLNPGDPAVKFGQWFVDGGDVDHDGTPDVYVSDYNANRAYVYSGLTGAQIRSFSGDNNGGFGIGRMAGDVDQDGWGDLILAAWNSSAGASQAGKAFVYSGRTSAVLQTYTCNVPSGQLGFDANAMGDVNGDGRTDYLLTAASDNVSTGKVYLVAGNTVPFSRADIDLDGDVDEADVEEFVAVLLGSPLDPLHVTRSDLNGDGRTDGLDVAAYLAAL